MLMRQELIDGLKAIEEFMGTDGPEQEMIPVLQGAQSLLAADETKLVYLEECCSTYMAAYEALMKKNEPRMLTGEEIQDLKSGDWVWVEKKGEDHVYHMEVQDYSFRGDKGIEFLGVWGNAYQRLRLYGNDWRLWSQHPTEQQRKEAKWDDD